MEIYEWTPPLVAATAKSNHPTTDPMNTSESENEMTITYPDIKPGGIQDYLGGLQTGEVLRLAEAAIVALGLAGSEEEWDSGTIEWVLGELEDAARPLGFPPSGSAGNDDALRFWAELVGNERTLEMLAELDDEDEEA